MSVPNSPHVSPRKGKFILAKVLLLDDVEHVFQIPHKALGYILFDEVCRKLQLLECDYFDLEYIDHQGIANWVDHEKQLLKQVSTHNLRFKFLVKFYTPDPGLLEDEYTRYLFALQMRRDIYSNNMLCQEHTWLLLAAYIVQAEIGDFLEDEYLDHTYLVDMQLIPGQTEDQTIKLMEHHKELVGLSPAEADFNLLDTARKVDMYGIHVHTAKDHEGVLLNLSVAHMGVQVFQSMTRINTFSWAKIRKLSFKRKKFLIKLHPEGYGYYKDTVEFYFDSRNECKNFWKKCIEHHAFFRCSAVKRVPRNRTRIVSRGSSFRYSGRTQKQLIEYVRANYTKRPPFERSASMRTVSMRPSTTPNTGTLNSRDFHHSHHSAGAGGHNTSTSSGSHILDTTSRDRQSLSDHATLEKDRLERVDIHDSSLPHKRDLQMSNHHHPHGGDTDRNNTEYHNGRSPHDQQQINPRQFMLSDMERNRTEPVFSHAERHGRLSPTMSDHSKSILDEQLTRSHETNNIPESVTHQVDDRLHPKFTIEDQYRDPSPVPPALQMSPPRYTDVMAHQNHPHNISYTTTHEDTREEMSSPRSPPVQSPLRSPTQSPRLSAGESTPPPPPPIYEGSVKQRTPQQQQQINNKIQQRQLQQVPTSPTWSSSELPQDPVSPARSPTNIPPASPARSPINIPPMAPIRSPTTVPISSPTRSIPPTSPVRSPSTVPPLLSDLSLEKTTPHKARSITSGASVGLTSSCSITSSRTEDSADEDGRRKRYPADKAYYIAKELLMTERTYKKDLEVITVWFHDFMTKEDILPRTLSNVLFSNVNPIYDFHCSFLKEIEQRLALWEGRSNAHLNGDYQRIGDVFINTLRVLQFYMNYLGAHEEILIQLEELMRKSRPFEKLYKEFEAKLICYLPLNTFLLKPAQRLLHYRLILERLMNHYTEDHIDYKDCKMVLKQMIDITEMYDDKIKHLENLQKLIELQRDLIGIDTLMQGNRSFIREGCLQKLSRKGFQQRMFFLLSDMLVYTSRAATPFLQFKVHGQLPLRGMIVEVTDPKIEVNDSFSIYAGNRCLIVAAGSKQEKEKWLEDLRQCIQEAKDRVEDKIQYPSLKSNSSSDNLEDSHEEPRTPPTPDRKVQQRANTTIHVCWHRNTSVSMRDHNIAIQNQLSGFLLRKFKNSNGWQKLWVVFTNFCLFFYKTVHEDFPLASLPLLGYTVSTPSETDGIHKDYVFKLQFKNHVYFFRAESEYTFERWVEVIGSATGSATRTNTESSMDASLNNGEV